MTNADYINNLESKIPCGQLRTRFAPSPTGYMHLGGLRTALYAYLLAKKSNGVFILRIEDTDQERFVEGAAELIYETLKSAGIFYNEGPDVGGPVEPYIQSQRLDIYAAYINLLIEKGRAYPCFCSKDELNEQRSIHRASRVPHKYDGRCALLTHEEVAEKKDMGLPYVIRQKISKEGSTSFVDAVFGRIEVENSTIDDTILIKADGMPTYNFANVVDDHLMGITHIIRGNEFLSSTPKYILLYESFGWRVPEFIHCSPIMRDATNKLSKRDGDAYFSDFVEKGYLVEAILNYIALLGWSPGGEEIEFSLSELEEVFDIKGISKDPSIFDYKNLNSLNASYIRKLSEEDFHAYALPYITMGVKRDIDTFYAAKILKERCEYFSQIPELLDFVDELPAYSTELYRNKKMGTNPENVKETLAQILSALEKITDWTQESIQSEMLSLASRLSLTNGQILWPLRVALSGKTYTPGGGIELSVLLGKDESIARIACVLQEGIEEIKEVTSRMPESADEKIEVAAEEDIVEESEVFIPRVAREIRSLTDIEEIGRIADLAKLEVAEDASELSEAFMPVMALLDRLKIMELPIGDYALNLELVNVFREDAGVAVSREDILRVFSIAPVIEAGCISVPKVMAMED